MLRLAKNELRPIQHAVWAGQDLKRDSKGVAVVYAQGIMSAQDWEQYEQCLLEEMRTPG